MVDSIREVLGRERLKRMTDKNREVSPITHMKYKISGIIFSGLVLTGMTNAASAQGLSADVSARYSISMAGFSLGNFYMNSRISRGRYSMSSQAKISLLGGLAYTWEGIGQVNGVHRDGRTSPSKYTFKFRDSKKQGKIRMSFGPGRKIKRLAVSPKKPLHTHAIPVTRAHMNGAYDPLSALLTLIRKRNNHRSVCNNRIPVFDGKVRFDLALSYKKSATISSSQSGGYSGPLTVCQVRYIPIAGHRSNNKQTRYMANARGIEVWLMPLPKSRLYVPYQIVVPTRLGQAIARSTHFELKSRGGRRVALVQK